MTDFFTPSLVTAITSLVISLVALFQFYRNQNFQQKQFNKTINRNLTTKLYDLRLEIYPKAFEITDNIYKDKGGNFDTERLKNTLNELIEWKKGKLNLIISSEALESYYQLRNNLMKNPANNNNYSAEQIEKITNSNNNFRKQLRRDLGFLFKEEKERRNSK
ncbi:hypothetical protein [Flavobacterium succinicans]|jgi:hypothetical protein|uniref:Uncharacterized protein n=1 Tax=Flavobacterium succinicans TaxID=29536 RepID=A0A199XRV9_9FLAO|nr:hypothetical protein [Flavobacterium succinicans]OAZ04493.1 hypothetical protein FLB_11070 [Flavobacterium succinicans]